MLYNEYFGTDGNPKKCTRCKSNRIGSKIEDTIDGTVCEQSFYCSDCGHPLGYWAYGHFDPTYYEGFKRERILHVDKGRLEDLAEKIKKHLICQCKATHEESKKQPCLCGWAVIEEWFEDFDIEL